ncbi:MAG: hypothetical protein M1484_04210 [Patescibacteria group bacterium]|nr:hypothetical protein [Patescibacteria group bacterium]MCL5432263.1 hypothetical protein [Patescibacteria group bacterium]
MTEAEGEKLRGKVNWQMKASSPGGARYISGLEELEQDIPFFKKRDGIVFWLFRDIAIAKGNPGGEQQDVVKNAKLLVEQGKLTQDQLNHIYHQFEFDPETYRPLNLKAQWERIANALRDRTS